MPDLSDILAEVAGVIQLAGSASQEQPVRVAVCRDKLLLNLYGTGYAVQPWYWRGAGMVLPSVVSHCQSGEVDYVSCLSSLELHVVCTGTDLNGVTTQ